MFPWPARANEPNAWDEYWSVFRQALTSNPRYYQNWRTQVTGHGFEPTPVEDLLGSSPLLDLVRQYLPDRLKSTRLGAFIDRNRPGWVDDSEIGSKAHEALQNLRLGGYDENRMTQFWRGRQDNPDLMRNTVHRGEAQRYDDPTFAYRIQDRGRIRAAQAAGVATADLLQQGLPYIWWGLNAAPAMTAFATLHATHRAGDQYGPPMPLLKRRAGRMLMAAPAWIGMNLATGQFGRQAGFSAASPSAEDPTIASDPLSETLSRVFLGRSGNLLPYDEFIQERPDVTRGEYEAYKAYLHGNKMPIKATLDGINGPEISFIGKSVPLATGLLPAVAMALGARYGARRAARRLANHDTGDGVTVNLLEQRQAAWNEYQKKGGHAAGEAHSKDMVSDRPVAAAVSPEETRALYDEYAKIDRQIEDETLRQAIGYGSIAMTGTALTGATLEALRRALKGKAPVEEEEPELRPPADLPNQP
ncbi:MAG: hypothetical protein VKI63_02510 [Cyanobium sp.]|nr:hypothetical protein [Cyanobium sp.]